MALETAISLKQKSNLVAQNTSIFRSRKNVVIAVAGKVMVESSNDVTQPPEPRLFMHGRS